MKKLVFIMFLLVGYFSGYAQVGIGVQTPSSSAMLDIHSAGGDKGVLLPKIALTSLTSYLPIKGDSSDARNVGLLIYNTTEDSTKDLVLGYYYWTGSSWVGLPNTSTIIELISNQIINGGVYYGTINGGTKEVLYIKKKDAVTGIETNEEIDLFATILNNITHISAGDLFEMKKMFGYDISEHVVFTGISVKGKYLYTVYGTTQIQEGNAEVGGLTLSQESLALLAHGEIYSISLLNSQLQVIDMNTTDIVLTTNGLLKFSLGSGSLYQTLPAGEYGVIVELLSDNVQL